MFFPPGSVYIYEGMLTTQGVQPNTNHGGTDCEYVLKTTLRKLLLIRGQGFLKLSNMRLWRTYQHPLRSLEMSHTHPFRLLLLITPSSIVRSPHSTYLRHSYKQRFRLTVISALPAHTHHPHQCRGDLTTHGTLDVEPTLEARVSKPVSKQVGARSPCPC